MAARVISGKAKGRRLKLVPGDTTRPIMDRVKENLFNILGDVAGTRWLDLFAGTGQVGIEALSRGAAEVIFVDKARPAIQTIRDNLAHTRLTNGAVVVQGDAHAFLRDFAGPPFDLIYVAPPQYKEMWSATLGIIDAAVDRYLTTDGLVVVQIDPREYKEVNFDALTLDDERRYGNTLLCFYRVLT
jgi:16S rRNA (guanine(966)-N(2))-methyltransferase RsmD